MTGRRSGPRLVTSLQARVRHLVLDEADMLLGKAYLDATRNILEVRASMPMPLAMAAQPDQLKPCMYVSGHEVQGVRVCSVCGQVAVRA